MPQVPRESIIKQIRNAFKTHKIVALVGPRQVGKTTIAKIYSKAMKAVSLHFFDLEDPTDYLLLENAKLTLDPVEGFIIIDEIQRRSELFTYLKTKADKMKSSSKILLLGSSSRELIEKSAESLAGRICYIEIQGLSYSEAKDGKRLFARGGFPISYFAKSESQSYEWRKSYIQSFVERDLRLFGFDLPPHSIRRYMEMLTGFHGQIFNASEIGKSMGLSHTTARKYLDILVNTFLVRELKPWNESIIQRQVKQPKIYIRDIGLLYNFLGLKSFREVSKHPRLGSFWEGFALEELTKQIKAQSEDLYFWSLHQGGELDLLWKNGSKKIGFEFKYSDRPEITRSERQAVKMLNLDKLFIIYPGDKEALLDEKVCLLPLHSVPNNF